MIEENGRKMPMQKRTAFTLIELLVVVAIIAVLLSILLPAFTAARTAARTTVCLSNYRQLAIGVGAYMNDNRDYLPPPVCSDGQGGWPDWSGKVISYLGTDKVLQDPAALGEKDPRWGHPIGGYGMNAYWIVMGTSYGENKDYNSSIVADPTKEVVFCCNRGMWSVGPLLDIYDPAIHPSFWGGGNDQEAQRCRMATRHGGSPNVMFLDLHAEHISVPMAKMWSDYWIQNNFWPPMPCWLPQSN
jgi:prepilin-type N-terminal cleavage/methylation domain-containing protein/prepilin-type processing-associated H-X9-DG protein